MPGEWNILFLFLEKMTIFPACFIIHENLLFPKYICSSKSMEVA